MRQLTPIEKQRGEQLAQFLNSDMDKYGEVGELLESCQQVHSLYEKRPPLSPSPERVAYEQQQGTLLSGINRRVLCKYQVIPRLVASEQGLAMGWESVQPLAPEVVQALRAFKSGIAPITAHSAVHIVLDMTTAGMVDRIRRCENPDCGKWMMVTSTKRLTCSDACRFEKYQMQKGSRANYVRELRKFHKKHPQLKKQKKGKEQ